MSQIVADSPDFGKRLDRFEIRLGYHFENRSLLILALTHRSVVGEAPQAATRDVEAEGQPVASYERLEFLGDSVLGLVTAEWLYRQRPEDTEGALARSKSYLVSAPVLAEWAGALGVGELLVLGGSEEQTGGRKKRSLLADSMEAIFGAVFLDGGIEAAGRVIRARLETAWQSDRASKQDAKTRLQELLQAQGRALPDYRLMSVEGPDHDTTFHYQCLVDGAVVGEGTGRSKKEAERRAARAALASLEQSGLPGQAS